MPVLGESLLVLSTLFVCMRGVMPQECGAFLFLHLSKVQSSPISNFMSAQFHASNELKLRYLLRKNEELVVCRQELANHEYVALRTLAHQMRGNAASFDFILLENLGILLDRSIQSGDSGQIREVLEDIQHAITALIQRLGPLPFK